jgi:SAM-dependent methyltransferase
MFFWHAVFLDETSDSPMRSYLDAFMGLELTKLLPPSNVSIFDIGCGTAYVRSLLTRAGYSGTYTGIDVVKEPKFDMYAYPEFITVFLNQDIATFKTNERFDLVISNTSLEHIENDTQAVVVAHSLVKEGGIEVHLVPSLWSLPLYLWHGYRQYTPARIRKIFKGSNYKVYRMGGLGSFLLHFFYITIPERFLGVTHLRAKPLYKKLKVTANKIDKFFPLLSSLYAVAVFHGKK